MVISECGHVADSENRARLTRPEPLISPSIGRSWPSGETARLHQPVAGSPNVGRQSHQRGRHTHPNAQPTTPTVVLGRRRPRRQLPPVVYENLMPGLDETHKLVGHFLQERIIAQHVR